MPLVSIGLDIQQRWTLPCSASVCGSLYGSTNQFWAHPIYCFRWHSVTRAEHLQFRHIRCTLNRCAHGIFVVLDNKDDGEFPKHRHVERFVQYPLPSGTVSKEAHGDVVFVAVFVCEGNACSESNLSSYNAMSSEKIPLFIEHVHGTTFSLARSGFPSVELSHHKFRICPKRQWVRMIAIRGDHAITWTNRFRDSS